MWKVLTHDLSFEAPKKVLNPTLQTIQAKLFIIYISVIYTSIINKMSDVVLIRLIANGISQCWEVGNPCRIGFLVIVLSYKQLL